MTADTVKRAADVLLVIFASPLAIIITAVIAIIIRLTSGPPIFFTQQRAAKNAKPFMLCKFRTMQNDVDPFGPSPKSGADTRLTSFGRLLRSTSLDELPQLWNVLTGDMSLVGPRPLYLSQVAEWSETQRRRLLVKPGLTGLAQISGRGSLTIEEKLALDVKYVENQSFALDARILLTTIFAIFRPRGIYEQRYSATQTTRQSPDSPPPDPPNRPNQ